MNKFIKDIGVFGVLLALLLFVAMFITKLTVQNRVSYNIDQRTSSIVLGHSHSECAFNDERIPGLENLSISGEAYFYTYTKLKEVVSSNENVDLVFIEFTNNQISESINDWVWKEKYLSYHYAIHGAFIDWRDKLLILKNNPRGYIANLPVVFKSMLKSALKGENLPSVYGGYTALEGDLFEYEKKDLKEGENKEDFVIINEKISEVQLNYLDKIISFLREKNIQMCLIRSPEHESYSGLENEDTYQDLLKNRFADVLFLDLKDFPLGKTHFRDPEHLNSTGANIVSDWLGNLLGQDQFFNAEKKHWTFKELEENYNN